MGNNLDFFKTSSSILANIWLYLFGLLFVMIMIASTIFPKEQYFILLYAVMFFLSIIVIFWGIDKIFSILLLNRNFTFKQYIHNLIEIGCIIVLLYLFHLFFYPITGYAAIAAYPYILNELEIYAAVSTLLTFFKYIETFSVVFITFEYFYHMVKNKKEEINDEDR